MTSASDETLELGLRFDSQGLIPAIIVDESDNIVLMFAFMNAQALAETQHTGIVHFWSRSRGALWKKGETSGETFVVVDMCVDCDQDALILVVRPAGPACHTGESSCFYRRLNDGALERLAD